MLCWCIISSSSQVSHTTGLHACMACVGSEGGGEPVGWGYHAWHVWGQRGVGSL